MFHPNAPIVSQFLDKHGIVRLTIFEDNNLKEKLADALRDAYAHVDKNRVSVITNETSATKSVINKFVFTKEFELNWKSVVLKDIAVGIKRIKRRF